jgi:tetratricopeptide (TPR) repeat protein
MSPTQLTARWIAALSLALVLGLAAGCGGAKARVAGHLERGQEYLANGNYEKARVEFRNALQIDPRNAEARFLSGQVAERLNNPREAVAFYQAAVEADPGLTKARANLGRLYLFAGVPDRALKLVEPALAKAEDAGLLTVRGGARLQANDMQGALADARRAIELDAGDENAVALLAGIYRRLGENEKALAVLVDAVQRAPKSAALREVLVQLRAQEGDRAGMQQELKDLIKLKPKDQRYRYQLALAYLRNKQVDEAEAVLREAVNSNPKTAETKLALVDFLAAQRSPARGQEELRTFIDREPDNYDLRFGLARLYQSDNQSGRAEAVYREVIDRDHTGPSGLKARNLIATLKIRANKLDEAERLLAEVLKENPRDNDALILRANIALSQNRPEATIADLRTVLRDQPNSVPLLRALAQAHLANGDPALAEESLKSAVELSPRDVDARLELARIMAQRDEGGQALALLEKVVIDAPDNLAAREALFRAQAAAKQLEEARRTADDIKLLRPEQALGYYLAGIVADAQGKPQESIREYEQALGKQPDAAEPLAALVRAQLSLHQVDAATNRLRSFIAKYPQNVVAPNLLAEIMIAQKRPADALQILAGASAREPRWWVLYRTMAIANLSKGNRAAAIESYRRGMTAVPSSTELAVDLAMLYEQGGQSESAIDLYEVFLKLNPKSEVAANNLAVLLVTHRRDQASLDRARDLVDGFARSSNPAFLDTHGWVQYKRGDFAAALPVLEQVADKVPESPVVRYHLAMAQLHAGQLGPARDNLERALKAGAKFDGAGEARATLDELKKKRAG